jgi:hypothetical protein
VRGRGYKYTVTWYETEDDVVHIPINVCFMRLFVTPPLRRAHQRCSLSKPSNVPSCIMRQCRVFHPGCLKLRKNCPACSKSRECLRDPRCQPELWALFPVSFGAPLALYPLRGNCLLFSRDSISHFLCCVRKHQSLWSSLVLSPRPTHVLHWMAGVDP